MKHNILPLNFLGGLAKSPASVFTTHLLSTNLWRGGERVSYSLDATGKNELPKCAEEGRDAAFCKQRDNVLKSSRSKQFSHFCPKQEDWQRVTCRLCIKCVGLNHITNGNLRNRKNYCLVSRTKHGIYLRIFGEVWPSPLHLGSQNTCCQTTCGGGEEWVQLWMYSESECNGDEQITLVCWGRERRCILKKERQMSTNWSGGPPAIT